MATPNQLTIQYGTTGGSGWYSFPTDDLRYSIKTAPVYRQDEKIAELKIRIGDQYNVMVSGIIDASSAQDLTSQCAQLKDAVTKEWGSLFNTTTAAMLRIKMGTDAVNQWTTAQVDGGFHCANLDFPNAPEKHAFFAPFNVEFEFVVKTIAGNILEKQKNLSLLTSSDPNEGDKSIGEGSFTVADGSSASSAAATLVTTSASGYSLKSSDTKYDENDRNCIYRYVYQKDLGTYPAGITGQDIWINYCISENNKKRWSKQGWYEGSGASAAASAAIPGTTVTTFVTNEIEQNQNTNGRVNFRFEWDAVAVGTDYMRWESSVRQFELRTIAVMAPGGAGSPAHFKGPLQGYLVEERGSAAHPSAYPSVPAALFAEGSQNCTIAISHTPQKADISLNEKETRWFRQYYFSDTPTYATTTLSLLPATRP